MTLLSWKEVAQVYGPSTVVGYRGKVRIFSIRWNLYRLGEDENGPKYVLSIDLPAVRLKEERSKGEIEELKVVAEEAFRMWLEAADLVPGVRT